MTANAALGMAVATLSLVLSAAQRSSRALRISRAAAVAVLALGLLTLLEYGGLSVGLDRLLPVDAAATHPGRPSPQTALGFVLIGICLAFAQSPGNRVSQFVDYCGLGLLTLVLVLIGGYIFRATELIGINATNPTSPQTLFCLIVLAFVIATRRASRGGFFSFWLDCGNGSRISRTALPAIIALPFLAFSLIELLDRSDLLSRQYSRALAAPIAVVGSIAVIRRLGRRVNEAERALRAQSLTDQLTDVFNRRGFYTVADYAIRSAKRAKTGFVLFYFDLDGLKAVNDRHGHEEGSMMIRRFANILSDTFRMNDVVGRVGGDEFVVLAANTTGTATSILGRLAKAVEQSNISNIAAHSAILYSSGYVDVPPLTEVNIDDLIAMADVRMYDQKTRKGNSRREAAALQATCRGIGLTEGPLQGGCEAGPKS